MRQDGICQVTRNHYTKTIQFRDINYQLSDNEDKQAIFDSWCDFLNYFDSSVSFQLSFINLTGLRGAALRTIPVRTDQFESIQRELSEVIRNQQEKMNRRNSIELFHNKQIRTHDDPDSPAQADDPPAPAGSGASVL